MGTSDRGAGRYLNDVTGRILTLGFVIAVLAAALPRAHADDGATGTEVETPERDGAHWRWQRFHLVEGVVASVALAAGVGIVFGQPDVGVRWTHTLPLDDELRGVFRLSDDGDRELAATLGDATLFVMLGWPILIDAVLLAGAVHGDWDAMVQMAMIDVEVLAIAFAITELTTRFVGRERPNTAGCHLIPEGQPGACAEGIGHHTSFVGGHALMMFASAGLTCSHHIENPWLTGSSEGAAIACGSGLLVATAGSTLRLMADLHWASDVAIGASVGALLGFLLPYALHYVHPQRPAGDAETTSAAGPSILGVVPRLDANERGLGVLGVF